MSLWLRLKQKTGRLKLLILAGHNETLVRSFLDYCQLKSSDCFMITGKNRDTRTILFRLLPTQVFWQFYDYWEEWDAHTILLDYCRLKFSDSFRITAKYETLVRSCLNYCQLKFSGNFMIMGRMRRLYDLISITANLRFQTVSWLLGRMKSSYDVV